MDNMKTNMYSRAEAARRSGWSTMPMDTAQQGGNQMPTVLPVPMSALENRPVSPPSQIMPIARQESSLLMPMPPSQAFAPNTTDEMDDNENCIHMVVGMSYIPWQRFRDLYEPEEGFPRGTIFAELDYPFLGKGNCHHDRT